MKKFDLSDSYHRELAHARLLYFLRDSGMFERLETEINSLEMNDQAHITLSNDQVAAVTRWVFDVITNIDPKSTTKPNTSVNQTL